MKLYYAHTLNARKPCAVAKHLQLPVEYVFVDLGRGEHKTPAFQAMNPNAKVPLLQHDDGRTLWESGAIMCQLALHAESDLWPRDARQIDVLRWLHWDATEFLPASGTFYFEHIIKPAFGMGPPDGAEIERATSAFLRYGRVLDDHLRDRKYLVGEALTVADFAVAAGIAYAPQSPLPLAGFAAIRRWHARLEQLDAWREPFPATDS